MARDGIQLVSPLAIDTEIADIGKTAPKLFSADNTEAEAWRDGTKRAKQGQWLKQPFHFIYHENIINLLTWYLVLFLLSDGRFSWSIIKYRLILFSIRSDKIWLFPYYFFYMVRRRNFLILIVIKYKVLEIPFKLFLLYIKTHLKKILINSRKGFLKVSFTLVHSLGESKS